MSLFHHQGLKILTNVLYLENSTKFYLDLCSPSYRNSPLVSYLGMNPGRGWNPDLEESYLPEYSESEVELVTQCSEQMFLFPVKISASEPSPISRYSESTKTTSSSILGFQA